MTSALLPIAEIPSFTFRVSADEVEGYRRALGVTGNRVPLGMALRALASDSVTPVLREVAEGRHLVHVAQDYSVKRYLSPDIDYTCDVRLQYQGDSKLRIEQELRDPAGRICVTLASEIMLVAA